MPTYVYETIPGGPGEAPERFEVRQSMAEPALERHPERDVPVRRVLSGGLVTFTQGTGGDACAAPGGLPSMGCGAGNCCQR